MERSKRVLVVDDSADQREALVALLRRWGFDVGEARDGREALAFPGRPPDIVLAA